MPDEEVLEEYYPDGSLKTRREVKRAPDGTPINHGNWVAYHPNGQKRAQGIFYEGKLEGEWTFWHPNGQKSGEGTYESGKQHGTFTYWDAEGVVTSEGTFVEGRLLPE